MFIKAIQITPICPACQTPMRLIPAGVSKSSGKPYRAFYSCPHNRECGSKTIPYIEPQEIPVVKETPKPQPTSQQTSTMLIMDELKALNEKVDGIQKDIAILINEISPSPEEEQPEL